LGIRESEFVAAKPHGAGFKAASPAVKTAALLFAALLLGACDSASWYLQAARGHLEIMGARQDLRKVLQDPDLPPELAAKLEVVLDARMFAETELGLPAAGLGAEGFDTHVGGVAAYSTLGWFDDAVFSTVLNRPDHQLAALIFHELAHQVAYIPGDTTLNESFATVVETEGQRRWLETRRQSALVEEALADAERRRQFVEFVTAYRERFGELYSRDLSAAEMRREKAALQARMRGDYGSLKARWGGYAGYDGWFSRSLNNAQLSTVGSYNDLAPQLRELLRIHDNDLPAFYEKVRELGRMRPERRAQYLRSFGDEQAP